MSTPTAEKTPPAHYALMVLAAALILVGPLLLHALLPQPGWPILIGIFLVALVFGSIDARVHKSNWGMPTVTALAYLVAMLLFFNEGTGIYLPVVFLLAGLGGILGDPQVLREEA